MKKTKVETLAVKIVHGVKPPLRRGELVEALARKLIAQLGDKAQKIEAAYHAAEIALNEKAKVLLADPAMVFQCEDASIGFKWCHEKQDHSNFYATRVVELNKEARAQLAPEIREVLRLKVEKTQCKVPDLHHAKAIIREQLDGTPVDRVGAALNDPETSKALDAMLVALNRPKQAALVG